MVAAAVVVFRWRGGCGGGSTVVAAGRVRESGVEDRIDRGIWSIFGFAKKISPEKFSGGGRRRRVVAGGRPPVTQTSVTALRGAVGVTIEFFISLRDFSNRFMRFKFALRNRVLLWRCLKIRVLRWTADEIQVDQKSLSEKKKKEEHLHLL
nr:hypothetical protein [Tanacetum cinerariifolium]